jgi:tRNA(Ile2) C34 agmatinyltransferase TiaS
VLHREYVWIRQELAEEVPLGTLSADEYAALTSFRRRGQARAAYQKRGGPPLVRRWQALIKDATELALKKQQARRLGPGAESAQIGEWRQRILALRAELGQVAASAPVCPHCGHRARPGGRFCGHCGRPLTNLPES